MLWVVYIGMAAIIGKNTHLSYFLGVDPVRSGYICCIGVLFVAIFSQDQKQYNTKSPIMVVHYCCKIIQFDSFLVFIPR